ncbi:predicted protein [Uncinocarpus reesii 1704]|uniref:Dienelactone hydrolase domain-containing protein n=1 Tax=Uncinocarpus reesii (strain UAMH 1704) TaxID=336963 RepID=C4JFE7_UNCRE|nr:uncharacterized protein UREG_00961 [Uncinocarpus reesii 1704]EEP76112.1 predicted protein [Uncinocarpus reesii 1704]
MKGIQDTLRRRRTSLRRRLSHSRRRSSSQSHDTESSWNETGAPKILLTASTLYFDPSVFQRFREEGYDIAYLPHAAPPKQYKDQLQRFADVLEEEDRYAIVAYGEAAAVVLDACMSAMPRLCAVVAYYPPTIPNATDGFPPLRKYQIHLAETQQLSGIPYCYTYHGSDVGFAERDSPTFDRVSAQLAWSRTIACLRVGFEITVDVAPVWENHMSLKHDAKDVDGTMNTLAEDAYINYVPVMTGGSPSSTDPLPNGHSP